MHCLQLLMAFCICMAILGHQNQSCSKYRVYCLTLVSSISVIIHSWQQLNDTMGTTNCKTSSNFTSQCVAKVEGSLVEHQLFLLSKDSFPFLSICIVSQQVFQILYFLVRDPLNCSLKYWILLLGSHPFSHM